MTHVGRIIMIAGLVVVVIGAVVWLAGRLGFRGMPGDIRHESEGFSFYFPIVTCLVVSIALTAGWWLVAWVMRWWGR